MEGLDRRIGQRRDATRAPTQARNGWRPSGRLLVTPLHHLSDGQNLSNLWGPPHHLFININTDQGVFGTRQTFVDGLNIIRAENYAGKSEVVQAIMYALGMEGMQSPSHAVPLAHALTEYLEFVISGQKRNARVIDSMVSIEIEKMNLEQGRPIIDRRAGAEAGDGRKSAPVDPRDD